MELRDYEAFADQWLQAWNNRDVEAILAHYTDDIELTSPIAAHLLGNASGIVAGKALLRHYVTTAFEAFPGGSGSSLLGVCQGVGSVIVQFRFDGGEGAELMELTTSGKVRRAIAHFKAVVPPDRK